MTVIIIWIIIFNNLQYKINWLSTNALPFLFENINKQAIIVRAVVVWSWRVQINFFFSFNRENLQFYRFLRKNFKDTKADCNQFFPASHYSSIVGSSRYCLSNDRHRQRCRSSTDYAKIIDFLTLEEWVTLFCYVRTYRNN